MRMKNDIKTVSSSTQRNDFKSQWRNRRQWKDQVEKTLPDDVTFLRWAEKAQQNPVGSAVNPILLPFRHNKRWISYVAAASILIGVSIIALTLQRQPDNGLPVAKEVTVDSQTIHFVCNNGCSAQDIMLLANKVIK